MSGRATKDGVRTYHVGHGCYPWRFEVAYQGKVYGFAGIPNKCETRREAAARAVGRLRWFRRGEFDEKYVAPPPFPPRQPIRSREAARHLPFENQECQYPPSVENEGGLKRG
jgi:hypothetical protein